MTLQQLQQAERELLAALEDSDKQMQERWGKTHTFKRVYSKKKVNLDKLRSDQSVCWGDGKTFYYLLTKKAN